VVSQFTLYGDARRGRRPSFSQAAPPEKADELYKLYVSALQNLNIRVQTGRFRARMLVQIENEGPVTIVIDTAEVF
jgi:D-tyrosyl-tRNA(Tyr) deacylase